MRGTVLGPREPLADAGRRPAGHHDLLAGAGPLGEPAVAHQLEVALEPIGVPGPSCTRSRFVIALTIVTILHVVIGEMVPKNIALAGPERTLALVPAARRVPQGPAAR